MILRKVDLKFDDKNVPTIAAANGKRRKIAGPIRIRAIGTRKIDGMFVAEVRFRTEDGFRSAYFQKSVLLPHRRDEIRIRLADLGYEWPEDKAMSKVLLDAVAIQRPKRRFMLVPAPGWYDSAFVLPGQLFDRKGSDIEIRLDPSTDAHVGAFTIGAGDLDDWKRFVAKPSQKSSRLRLAIVSALAAPFLRPLGLDSFAINLFGATSAGKTISLLVAASVDGNIGDSGLPGWADSEAGIEDQARGHRDCVMALDETADGDDGAAALQAKARRLAFLIARNHPRKLSRTYERNNALVGREWRIIVLSSSERALGAIAQEAGGRRLGGEDVRFIDVPASEEGASGIFDGKIRPQAKEPMSEATKRQAEALRANARKYQGHAKRALMAAFVNDPNGLDSLKGYKVEFEKMARVGESSKQYRIRSNFSTLYAAAALAIDYGVLPWKKHATFRAIKKCMRLAIAELSMTEGSAVNAPQIADGGVILRRLRDHVARASVVAVMPRARPTAKQVQSRQSADGFTINGKLYLKNNRLRSWFGDDVERSVVIDMLKRHGILTVRRSDTSTSEKKIAGIPGKPRYHVLDMKALRALE